MTAHYYFRNWWCIPTHYIYCGSGELKKRGKSREFVYVYATKLPLISHFLVQKYSFNIQIFKNIPTVGVTLIAETGKKLRHIYVFLWSCHTSYL